MRTYNQKNWTVNYNVYESQASVIGFDDCVIQAHGIGWRVNNDN